LASTAERHQYRDPYAVAQAKARKAANQSRQEILKKERTEAVGHPIRGIATPLVQSFDSGTPSEALDTSETKKKSKANDLGPANEYRNDSDKHIKFLITKKDLSEALRRSKFLAGNEISSASKLLLDGKEQVEESTEQAEGRAIAEEALRRISSISMGTSKDRLRANTQRCIDIFGRHNTDEQLPPRPQAPGHIEGAGSLPKMERAGPDTGSSEVQIAILTAKIRSLADYLDNRARNKDKMNKRNLRLLVHRRAKLMRYMRRKERGGPRWQNLINSLGLTEATWQGEISL
jgi:ribosomal protein S15